MQILSYFILSYSYTSFVVASSQDCSQIPVVLSDFTFHYFFTIHLSGFSKTDIKSDSGELFAKLNLSRGRFIKKLDNSSKSKFQLKLGSKQTFLSNFMFRLLTKQDRFETCFKDYARTSYVTGPVKDKKA